MFLYIEEPLWILFCSICEIESPRSLLPDNPPLLPDHLPTGERAYFMTDSKWAPADAFLTSTNATNGSGNLFVYFKDLLQLVSIDFVALLSSIVAEFPFMV